MMLALDGSDRIEERPFVDSPVAIEVARIIQYLEDRTLFIGARGLLKSTMLIYDMLRRGLRYPNSATLLVRSTKDMASEHIRTMLEELTVNDDLVKFFPEVLWRTTQERKRDGAVWSKEKLTFKRTVARKEGTIQASGVIDGVPISVHFGRITGDDMEDPRNVEGTRLASLREGFRALVPLLDGHGSVFNAIGTYHHPQGLHAQVMPEAGWQTIRLPAVFEDDIPEGAVEIKHNGEPKSILWTEIGGRPRYEPGPFLALQYASMGRQKYGVQYLARTPNEAVKNLDSDMLVRFSGWGEVDERIRSRCTMVLLVDPATGSNALTDPSCLLVCALYQDPATKAKRVYIVDGYYSSLLRAAGRLKVAMWLIRRWGVTWVRIEVPLFCEDDEELRKCLMRERMTHVQVQGIKPDRSKGEGVNSFLGPRLSERAIYINTHMVVNGTFSDPDVPRDTPYDLYRGIVREIDEFIPGQSVNDHCIDALNLLRDSKKLPNPPWISSNEVRKRPKTGDRLVDAMFGS